MARPVTSIDDIKHIATISANNDSTIGDLIALAVDKVGQDGSITIEESRSMETSIDVTEGFPFSAGYCASAFVNDERRNVMSYEEPLLWSQTIRSHRSSRSYQSLSWSHESPDHL